MSSVETLLDECRKAIGAGRKAGVTPYEHLRTTLRQVERAKAHLTETLFLIESAAAAARHTLATGARLAGHGFDDDRYSKVTTACAAIGFREAVSALISARMEFDADLRRHNESFRQLAAL